MRRSLGQLRSSSQLVPSGPSALVVEGEAGIGKTTVWLAGLERAQELGFWVLSARATEVESVLPYSGLAALLEGLDEAVFADLPPLQRLAIDRVLLRVAAEDGPVTDQQVVGAAFVSVVERLAERASVLIAIDDLQWLDPPSTLIISSAVRRLAGPVGIIATVRDGPNMGTVASWLELHRPERLHRLRVRPLSMGAVHTVLCDRLGRSFSRPTIRRIHDISGGNPFYALELARAMGDDTGGVGASLPGTLAELVRARIGRLADDAQQALLAASCLADPTVESVARAIDSDPEQLLSILSEAEDDGIVEIAGNRLRFAHPLLAHGVYTDATAGRRRAMHRRLADIVDEPELKARHLALAAATGDALTLRSLDEAAEMARIRGAPSAAAELVDLAIGLGGDTPERHMKSASYHFNAGDAAHARTMLERTSERPAPAALRAEALRLLGLWSLLDGSSREAADLLERALADAGDNLALRVQVLVPLSFAQVNGHQFGRARAYFEDAVECAMRLDQPQLLSQALSMRVLVRFLLGDGLDKQAMRRALELEDRELPMSALLGPSMQHAQLLVGTGKLEQARLELLNIRRRYIERGEESELIIVAFHSGLNEIWQGNFAEAARIAEDAMERASQLDRDLPISVALMIRSAVAAYAGHEIEARRDASEALAICRRCDSPTLVSVWPATTLGFLDVSLGNHDAALSTLEPLIRNLDEAPQGTEIFVAPFLPDAIEAMIQLGRLDEAEPLIELFEGNGRRLDRAWMSAAGGRCRGMLLAARGEVKAAARAVERALAEHDRLPMPFERARTQLLFGQLQRRMRHKDAAAATLRDAISTFERLETTLWAARARSELARTEAVGVGQIGALTPSERRVAELAASGMTNREVAAAIFLSPKTVEFHLLHIYRKLGIHSRAELGRRVGPTA